MIRRILVADADCALYGLLKEWFAGTDFVVSGTCEPGDRAQDGYDLIVVDVPFPREGGHDVVKALAREHPDTPIVALSSSFLPGIEACGAVARDLGAAGVLPKPLKCEALMGAVRKILGMK